MKQKETTDFKLEKVVIDKEQSAKYEDFICCLADIIAKSLKDKDIDNDFI